MKSVYRYYERSIVDAEIIEIHAYARFLTLLNNTSSTDIRVSIAGQPFEELPQGISVELPKDDAFTSLKFRNVSGATCTIKVCISSGRIFDNRVVISGDLNVTDISDGIDTPAPIIPLLSSTGYTIDNAAAVDKGGGLVGIPVTGQLFATDEVLTIVGTTNYDTTSAVVDATSSANEVVITATYQAETFGGTETIGLTTPRSIAADTTRKELIIQNTGSYPIWFGDTNINAGTKRGTKLDVDDFFILSCTAATYFMADTDESTLSINNLTKS